jgi:hypothetical protein
MIFHCCPFCILVSDLNFDVDVCNFRWHGEASGPFYRCSARFLAFVLLLLLG